MCHMRARSKKAGEEPTYWLLRNVNRNLTQFKRGDKRYCFLVQVQKCSEKIICDHNASKMKED